MTESRFPHAYGAILAQLQRRVEEPAPGRVQILGGPRQVGKTTLLLEIAAADKDRTLYAAADAPEAALPGWWEDLWRRAGELAVSGRAVLLIDEIQHLSDWSRRLKSQADRVRRYKLPLHIVVSGSSALLIGAGARESMAGRFERLRLLHWPARELAECFRLEPGGAVRKLLRFGGYPGAVALWGDPDRWRAYIRDAIIEPAIGRDVLLLESVRKPGLLRQLFAVCAGHPAEIISIQKLVGRLADGGALQTVAHYLHMLEEAFLVAPVYKYSERTMRRRSSPPKLVVLNQALLAGGTDQPTPEPERDPERWGRWVENACLAHAWNAGQNVSYWRAEPLEVDCVLDGSWGRWAIEVKTGRYGVNDLAGLLEFCRIHRGFRPLVLCGRGSESVARNAGVEARSWEDYLLNGP